MSAAECTAVDTFISVSDATGEGNGINGTQITHQVISNFLPPTVHGATPGEIEPYLAQLPAEEFLLFVGDLRPIKGLGVLLDAYAGLLDAPPLVLIGKTWPDTPTELPRNTFMLGKWPNYAVLEAWQRSKIGLVPSVWPEPFGIVVIEAMAGGSPVIASRIGGIPEIVADGETGILVPPGDPVALRQALETLLCDENLCRKMGLAAKRRAAEFDANAVVPCIEAIYRRVLES
jgi:glycosyltransferase involved in cell wall biosynthesis